MNITTKPIDWTLVQSVMIRMMASPGSEDELLLLAIGCYTGFRVSDWKSLCWGDFYDYDPNKGPVIAKPSITIREQKGRNVKGKKARTVPIATGLSKVLSHCYEAKRHPFLNVQLFKGRRGAPNRFLTSQGVRDRLKVLCAKWGLPVDTTTHSLRKSLAWKMYTDHGQNHLAMLYCQKMLGHSSPSITVRYLGIDDSVVNDFFKTL